MPAFLTLRAKKAEFQDLLAEIGPAASSAPTPGPTAALRTLRTTKKGAEILDLPAETGKVSRAVPTATVAPSPVRFQAPWCPSSPAGLIIGSYPTGPHKPYQAAARQLMVSTSASASGMPRYRQARYRQERPPWALNNSSTYIALGPELSV